jgi:hypothetical protein
LSLNQVLFFRTFIWTQGFPINYINGINDLIPAENKVLKELFQLDDTLLLPVSGGNISGGNISIYMALYLQRLF